MSDPSPQAPHQAEQSASAEILALEHELEIEHEQAAVALERVQQQLEDIEAAEPSGPRVTSASDTAEIGFAAADGLATGADGEDAHIRLRQRELELLAERDEAVDSLRAALAALERVEAVVPQTEEDRLEIEERIRAETEAQLREELQSEARGLAAAWLRGQVESIRHQAERAAEQRLLAQPHTEAAEPAPAASDDAIDLNAADFEQLRRLGMSVTQSTRVIAYRNRAGSFGEVDELDVVPGFTVEELAELKARLTA